MPGTSYTQLIPFSELAPGQAAAIRNEIVKELIRIAVTETGKAEQDLVVRDLRAASTTATTPGDLDYTTEDFNEVTGATAYAYETMSTGTNLSDRWIGIFGVKTSEDCAITALKFNVGGADRVIWQLQSLRKRDDWVGFCPSGIVIKPRDPYTISRYVGKPASQAPVILKGVCVEPRGKVISP